MSHRQFLLTAGSFPPSTTIPLDVHSAQEVEDWAMGQLSAGAHDGSPASIMLFEALSAADELPCVSIEIYGDAIRVLAVGPDMKFNPDSIFKHADDQVQNDTDLHLDGDEDFEDWVDERGLDEDFVGDNKTIPGTGDLYDAARRHYTREMYVSVDTEALPSP